MHICHKWYDMNMILLLHIGVALLSLAFAAMTFIVPSHIKLKISYGLVGLTLATGFYLVIMAPAHMAEACVMGLLYTSLIIVATVFTRRKLMSAEAVAGK